MTPTTDLGLSIRLSMFELRETGNWDIFPWNGRGRRLIYLSLPRSHPETGEKITRCDKTNNVLGQKK